MKKSLFDQLKGNMQKGGYTPKSVLALLIFGAIVAVFVLFGYSGSHQMMGSGSAGQVNSTLLSAADLGNETQRLEQMYAPMFGGKINGDAQRQFLRQQALENLISTELMAQGAQKMGIHVTDEEVRDVIVKEIPAFQENGRFQRERYQAIMSANRWTPGEFETRIRKERQTRRLQRLFEEASTPMKLELDKNKLLRETKRNVDYVRIDREMTLEKMPVTDAEVKKRLQDAEFAKRVQDDFQKNQAAYGAEEQVRASHILIKTTQGDAASETAALAKIQEIQKRAQKEDFAKLAGELSQDEGSKSTKGDLGFFTRGRMVPEFEKAAFEQKVGVVGEPVKSNFGYHLIKVTERKAPVEPKIEAAQEKIARKLIASDSYEQEVAALEKAVHAADATGVEKSLKALGLKWEESGFFDLGAAVAPKLGSAEATSLAMEVSSSQPWPKKLARDGGHLYLVKWKADKREPLPAGEKLETSLAREQSYDLMNKWLEDQRKSAHIERNEQALMGR